MEQISKQNVEEEEEEFDTDDENEVDDIAEKKNFLALGIIKTRLAIISALKMVKNISFNFFNF